MSRKNVYGLLGALGLMSLLFHPMDAGAQSESDTFSYEDANAHGSCDSKVLQEMGYKVAGKIPGKKKECYWVRPGELVLFRAEPQRPKLPDYLSLGDNTTMADSLSLARSRYGAAMGFIEQQRKNALAGFMTSLPGCGINAGCLTRSVADLKKKQAQFAEDEIQASADLQGDIRTIREHFALSPN
ncbi:MAG: hypothetical protein AAF495_11570 [Pseudomonadota bacterium]